MGEKMKKVIKNDDDYYKFEPITLNDSLSNLKKRLSVMNFGKIPIAKINNRYTMTKQTRDFFKHYDIILQKLPFIKYKTIEKCNNENIKKDGNLSSLIDLISECEKQKYPFDIPLIYDKNASIEYGAFRPIYIGEHKKDMQLIFSEYILTNKLSELTSGIYAHEIIHSELENANAIKSYLNYEVLPIFFDKLVSLYLDPSKTLLQKNELLRLKLLFKSLILLEKENLSSFESLNISMSITSLLKSENLFNKFIYGTNNDKIDMINDIQNIFDGNYYLEDLLQKNDITFDNSQNYKSLTKHI